MRMIPSSDDDDDEEEETLPHAQNWGSVGCRGQGKQAPGWQSRLQAWWPQERARAHGLPQANRVPRPLPVSPTPVPHRRSSVTPPQKHVLRVVWLQGGQGPE